MLNEGITLLQEFQKFKKKNPSGSMAEFGKFLSDTEESNSTSLEKMGEKMPFQFPADSIDDYLGWVWGRLIEFTHVWEKKAFANLDISNTTEFGILLFVLSHSGCSKRDVTAHVHQEKSTIYEVIKRLVSKNLIIENADENDKRVKSLTLSENGKQAAFMSLSRMKKVSKHLVAPLNETDKVQMFDALVLLDKYHQKCFEKYNGKRWEEMEKDLLS
ncbi:hypothetical protein GCM10011506_31900 [Marivirga lumbricoides]|uniref:HTH marR-type domain-containing protein n=1 Tax=Marivirga lumbricoides TaxID=1046115 RepID=A0ABQ1MSS7_9BACT|nr:hypothetical protein GCM10011506_31900 [Marivirga lumbricoides]